ncbi:MAG: DUF1801 domain-containing protein [Chitinophagaceae bacterium]
MNNNLPATIDEYIAGYPTEVQAVLEQIRSAVKLAAPGAEETVKYAMPTFTLNGNLVHFAAFKNHIGFYPAPTESAAFQKALSGYKTGKDSVQFPLDKPMPLKLITQIVRLRVKMDMLKAKKVKA